MEITPSTFEEQDHYHVLQAEMTRKLIAQQRYGLIKETDYNITRSIEDQKLVIQVNSLEAITKNGELLQIDGDSLSRELPNYKGQACFFVVYHKGEREQEVNQVLYTKPSYEYAYCTLDEIGEDSFPIVKLIQESDVWKVQKRYIPPCMTIGCHFELTQMQRHSIQIVHEIAEILKNKNISSELVLLEMLLKDWDVMDEMAAPKDLYQLLKKTTWLLSRWNVPDVTLPNMPLIPQFNNNDIYDSIGVFVQHLSDYRQTLNIKNEPKKIEQEVEDIIEYDGIIP